MRMSVDLPGAVRPEQAEDLALLDVEGHAVDGGEVPESLHDLPLDLDGGHHDRTRNRT